MDHIPESDCKADFFLDLVHNVSIANRYLYTPMERTLITIVMPCILCVSLIGNAAFLFTVARVKDMRTVTNFYLVNLGLADTCFLSMAVGEKLYRYLSIGVPSYGDLMGTWGCGIIYTGVFLPYFASLMLVTAVSLERYYAICKPLKHIVIWRKKHSARLVAASWSIAVVLTATILPGFVPATFTCIAWPEKSVKWTHTHLPSKIGNCSFIGFDTVDFIGTNIGSLVYSTLVQTIPFFFTLVANAVFYGKIIQKMKSRSSPTLSYCGSNAVLVRMRYQVTRMLMATGIVFFVCQAPYQIGCLAQVFQIILGIEHMKEDPDDVLYNSYIIAIWIGRILLYVNAAINPYIYNAANSRYRKALLNSFPCTKVNKKSGIAIAIRRQSDETSIQTVETSRVLGQVECKL